MESWLWPCLVHLDVAVAVEGSFLAELEMADLMVWVAAFVPPLDRSDALEAVDAAGTAA